METCQTESEVSMVNEQQETTEAEAKSERDRLLRKAYGSATQDLREQHRKDFEALYKARAAELGVEWEPRKTAEEKAKEQMEALLSQYPHLREVVVAEDAPEAAAGEAVPSF